MSAPVTLEDIARKIGVHRSTVSLALRNSPRISKQRREEIQIAAAQLGYRANPLVSALMRTRRSHRQTATAPIAFLTNYPERYGWRPPQHSRPDFFPGAAQRARELGYALEPFWLAEPGMTPERMDKILRTRGIQGILLARLPPGQEDLEFPWEHYACLAFGMTLRQPRLHRVTENHFDTVRQAIRRCRTYGYRRVGLVFSERDDSPRVGNRWRGAYFTSQWNLPAGDRVKLCPQDPPTFEQFREWFLDERPNALLASHAPPVLKWLERMQLRVPEDVGLVELQAISGLGCAGVDYNTSRIGALAADMLVGMMQRNEAGLPDSPHEILMTGDWHDGWSLPQKGSNAHS